MPFNFSSPEYLIHHKTRKNRVSPVSRASPAHMNSPLGLMTELLRIHFKLFLHREKPLALYVFSKDDKTIDRFVAETSSGAVCANDTLMYTAGNMSRGNYLISH